MHQGTIAEWVRVSALSHSEWMVLSLNPSEDRLKMLLSWRWQTKWKQCCLLLHIIINTFFPSVMILEFIFFVQQIGSIACFEEMNLHRYVLWLIYLCHTIHNHKPPSLLAWLHLWMSPKSVERMDGRHWV